MRKINIHPLLAPIYITTAFILLSFYPVFAQEDSAVDQIYRNIGSFCEEGETLLEEKCYKAMMAKAYVDVLINNGMSKEDIYSKIVGKYSAKNLLNEDIRRAAKERFLDEARKLKPRLFFESTHLNFGKLSKPTPKIQWRTSLDEKGRRVRTLESDAPGKIQTQFSISNKGEALLDIIRIQTTCDCMTVSLETKNKHSNSFGVLGSPQNWHQTLYPGETSKILLTFDLDDPRIKSGPFEQTIQIISNDPARPRAKITVEAVIQK